MREKINKMSKGALYYMATLLDIWFFLMTC